MIVIKKNLLLLSLVLISSISFGQKTKNKDKKGSGEKIAWGEPMKYRSFTSILHVEGKEFYSFGRKSLFQSDQINKHANMQIAISSELDNNVASGRAKLESLISVNDLPVYFMSDKDNGKNILYYRKLNRNCLADGPAIEVFSYEMPKGFLDDRGSYDIVQSKDKSHFVVSYIIPGKKNVKDKSAYKIYNSDFEIVNEGEYESKYEAKLIKITNTYLSNTGDYFMGADVLKENDEKGIFKAKYVLDKVILMHVNKDGLEEFDLDIETGTSKDRYISDFTFSSDDSKLLTFTGLYSDKNRQSSKGIFYFQMDFETKKIVKEGWNDFSKDFIQQNFSEFQKKLASKKEAKGKGTPELYSYDVKAIHTLPSGEMIGLLEQFYIRVDRQTNSKGHTTVTYHYYYNDIIAYKINKEGAFEWVKLIEKRQHSVDDKGFLSSFSSYITNGTINIMFNDNLTNYDAKSNYLKPKRLAWTSYRKKNACVAKVVVDIENGDINRYVWFKKTEVPGFVAPKQFQLNEAKNELLLMVWETRKKAKFGLLTY